MTDIHQHYCATCRAPWEHDGDQLTTAEQRRAGHRCPLCGTAAWTVYHGYESHEEMEQLEGYATASRDEALLYRERIAAESAFTRLAQALQRRHNDEDPQGKAIAFLGSIWDHPFR